MNLWCKNIAINGSNNEFLEPKMVLEFIFYGFSCNSMVCIIQNHKNLVLSPFWEILSKNGPIFSENGSRDFKSRYLIFHVFE